MKCMNIDELTYAIRLGGKVGLVFLAPLSALLVLVSILGPIANVDSETASRWVRLGLEAFLMGGWSFGSASLARQVVARVFVDPVAIFVGTLTGALVVHLMAVIFGLIASDAPPLIAADLVGSLACLVALIVLTRRVC